MSTFKKNTLAVALVAGLGLAGVAAAYTLTTGGDAAPVMVATADIVDATTDIGINEPFVVTLQGSDFILGRTTGFTIRYTLNNGATFGDTLDTADLSVGAAAPGWTPTIAAGGGLNDNFVVINMNPPTPTTTLTTGTLLTIAAATSVTAPTAGTGQILDSLTALQTSGNQVVATVQFVDPVTAVQIMPQQTLPILQSGNPVVIGCNTALGETAERIDVASVPAKTLFSPTGEIGGSAAAGTDGETINLGAVTVGRAAGFTSFSYLGTDTFTTVVTGDFSAFAPSTATRRVFLSSTADCAAPTVIATGTINTANNTVTFNYTGTQAATTATGFNAYLCAQVPTGNAVLIDATAVSAVTTFTRGATVTTGASCPLLPLAYNGSVVEVFNINPAGNTTAQSFIRVINRSSVSGLVTVTGIDDNGVAAAAPITFTLAAGRSMQINSEDLENGNAAKGLTGAWGDGAGKWRATVTGEFGGMRVMSLNRNSTDGTVTNLTDADGHGEQVWYNDLDGG